MNASGDSGAGWEVPEYRVEALRDRRSRHVVVVFVLNEGERVRQDWAGEAECADADGIVMGTAGGV